MARIGIDAFGGDNAPEVVVKGAILALEHISADDRIVLFGNRESIESVLKTEGCSVDMFDIDLGCYVNWWLPHPPSSMPSGCYLSISAIVKKFFNDISCVYNN